jgi:hypothetical protein
MFKCTADSFTTKGHKERHELTCKLNHLSKNFESKLATFFILTKE